MAKSEVWLLIAVGVVMLLFVPMMLFAPFTYVTRGAMGPWMMGSRIVVFWWPFMLLFPLTILALIGLGLYYLLGGQRSPRSHIESDALQILKERYAKGEITSEQYEKMKKELES